jgi:plastocyanin
VYKSLWKVSSIALLTVVAACGGADEAPVVETAAADVPAAPVAAPTNEAAPMAGGEVIEVKMFMEGGARFEPAQITAKPGDVIRFVNQDNVHNVSFPAAKNPGISGLPAASPYLTTPGQTYDLEVGLAPGTYEFQCDPHAAMGMTGELTVTE